jgi:hypothetical protein
MTEFNQFSPEWLAVREYAAARVAELTLSLRERQSEQSTQDTRVQIETLIELVRHFSPSEIEKLDEGIDFNL